MYTAEQALPRAVNAAMMSPCRKSKRGVVLWRPDLFDIMTIGYNHPPKPFKCDGSKACGQACRDVCVHAEVHAVVNAKSGLHRFHMLHVKAVKGEAVPSGPPSCRRCSPVILAAGIESMWLFHEDGLREYSTEEFHELTLQHESLPVIR